MEHTAHQNLLVPRTENGPILELVTSPISAMEVSAIKDHLGDTQAQFGARFHFSAAYAGSLINYGTKNKAMAAQFRLHFLEEIPNPVHGPEINGERVDSLVDICGGIDGLALETDLSRNSILTWCREKTVTGRWPFVFVMTLPSIFR